MSTSQMSGVRKHGCARGARGPLIGHVGPSVYVAVLHSAVCLGPTDGRLVAAELLDGTPHEALRRCRPHSV
ncbi:hypothetical protein ACH4E8_07485 [Streptomyces sp. NPDC017979]|uniref:hypothetical protein n=1 Tax=Streptomyces sp. NPDC017979 TaxID=3365024 RepID=UPI00378AF8E3